jgi:RNA polymerase sigma-70 factor (ECF subfamily)
MIDIDADTLKLASQGDMEAFHRVYRAAGGFVYNVAFRITRNSPDAEEVTQDVFMKVYRSLKDFQFRSSFATWVYRIAVNAAINRYRKTAKERNGIVDYDNLIDSLSDSRSTAEGALQNEAEARLNALLGKLSPEYKACLVLREIDGLSYREMAGILKIPLNTVRSRLKRARAELLEQGRKGLVKDVV